jgi:predicted transcriptional regulator
MTLQLNLPPELHERLRQEAERRQEPVEMVAVQLLDEHLPPPLDARRTAAIALLRQWMEEDAALTPEEEAANEEFFRSFDASRTSNRPLFPPELKGITWGI